jgi:hypothetical protein
MARGSSRDRSGPWRVAMARETDAVVIARIPTTKNSIDHEKHIRAQPMHRFLGHGCGHTKGSH